MLCAFEMCSGFCTFDFFKRFKILGISTKLTILCCFSLTTDPATWKNSRHLSKGFLYPFVFGPFSIMPACVLMYSYRLCAFFSSIFICLSTLTDWGFSGSCYLLPLHQNAGFVLVVNVIYFIFIFENMLVKPGLFYMIR